MCAISGHRPNTDSASQIDNIGALPPVADPIGLAASIDHFGGILG
jgi:hypothetical protein